MDGVNDYNCTCVVGYTGKNCSVGKPEYFVNYTTLKQRNSI